MAPDARTRLRDAALDRFGRNGIQATSTRESLAAAGMRNPSAISYHFGSKADLVEDLVAELMNDLLPVFERQIELGEGPEPPSVEDWAAIAVTGAASLLTTERGCLLVRVWWEYDALISPSRLEAFITSGDPLAVRWIMAVLHAMPDLPPRLAVFRNVAAIRMLGSMVALRASRLLAAFEPGAFRVVDEDFQQVMQEIVRGILSAPTTLTNESISSGP